MTDETTTTDGLTTTEIEADANAAAELAPVTFPEDGPAAAIAAGYEFNPPAPAPYLTLKKATVKQLSELLIGAGLDNTGLKPVLYQRAIDARLITDQKPVPPAEPAGDTPESDAEPAVVGIVVPESYTVVDEPSYIEVAAKFGIANFRELAAYNGVYNSRYELSRGDVVRLPTPKRG